jgi:hypothetical protein
VIENYCSVTIKDSIIMIPKTVRCYLLGLSVRDILSSVPGKVNRVGAK